MLKTVRKAFQIEDIRKRLFYTFLMLIVVRFGSQLPTPGVDPTYIQNLLASQNNGAYSFFDAFTGGSFTRMSVFALSITPYITSSIIMQLLTIAIPKLEEMQKEGAEGKKENCGNYALCDSCSRTDRIHCNVYRFWSSGTSGRI